MPVHDGARPSRVLLGNLEPVVRLGMTMVLEEDGVQLLGSEHRPNALVLLSARLRPDAVVLDRDHAGSRDLAERIRAACAETTVIFWTRDEEVMEVLDPGATEPRRFVDAVSDQLRSELMRSQVNQVER